MCRSFAPMKTSRKITVLKLIQAVPIHEEKITEYCPVVAANYRDFDTKTNEYKLLQLVNNR